MYSVAGVVKFHGVLGYTQLRSTAQHSKRSTMHPVRLNGTEKLHHLEQQLQGTVSCGLTWHDKRQWLFVRNGGRSGHS